MSLSVELAEQLLVLARRIAKPVQLHGTSDWTLLDRPAYQALWRIAEEGPLRLTTLAGQLEVDLSIASRQVKALTDAGFVQREHDPSDARAVLLSATPEGRRAFEVAAAARKELLDTVLAHWPAGDRTDLVRLLTRFNAEIETALGEQHTGAER